MANTALLLLLLVSSFAMCVAAVGLFLLLNNKKKKDGPGGSRDGPPGPGPGPAPEYKSSTYTGKELLSSSVSAVKGLAGRVDGKVYEDQPYKIIAGAPSSAAAIKQSNRKYSRADVKKMLAVSVNDAWPALKVHFGFEDWQKERVVALFIGQATKESTLRIDVETGTDKGFGLNPAHAYGPLQTAVTAFKGSTEKYGYMAESDVPQMKWYDWTAENFYDPMISNFMGLRKMCHMAHRAKTEVKAKDPRDILRRALKAFNTGWPNDPPGDKDWMDYAYQIGRMGEWYYTKGHMTDDAFTWTGNFTGNGDSFGTPASGGQWAQNYDWIWKK
jgi:hypothetical protein